MALSNVMGTVQATATDASGNIYVLTSTALSKWSPVSTSFVWTQPVGVGGRGALVVSGTNIYVTGAFQGPYTIGTTTLPGIGGYDLFVAKFSDAGALVWAQQAGGIGDDYGTSIVAIGSRVYICGVAMGTTAFGGITLVNAPSRPYIYIARLDDSGSVANFTWAESDSGYAGYNDSPKLAENGSDIYIAGQRLGSIGFGNITANDPTRNYFVFKLVDSGSSHAFIWAKQLSIAGGQCSPGLAVSGSSVYLAIDAKGAITINNTVIRTAGSPGDDVFLIKITDAGPTASFTWALRAGGGLTDLIANSPIAVSGGNIYLAGNFGSTTADFGATILTNAGTNNMFVAKVVDAGASGSFVWAQKAGGISNNQSSAVAIGPNGRVYVSGECGPSTTFGNTTLAGPVNTSIYYLASLTDPTLTATTAALRPESIGLFPNPAHGRATVQLPSGTGPATLTLLDALGRTLRTQTAPGPRAELDLSGLAPGLYAVRVQAGGSTATRRLVVE